MRSPAAPTRVQPPTLIAATTVLSIALRWPQKVTPQGRRVQPLDLDGTALGLTALATPRRLRGLFHRTVCPRPQEVSYVQPTGHAPVKDSGLRRVSACHRRDCSSCVGGFDRRGEANRSREP